MSLTGALQEFKKKGKNIAPVSIKQLAGVPVRETGSSERF